MFKYYYWVIEVNVGVVLHMPSYSYNEVKNVCTIFKKRGGVLCERDAEMLHLINTKCSMYGVSLKALAKRWDPDNFSKGI